MSNFNASNSSDLIFIAMQLPITNLSILLIGRAVLGFIMNSVMVLGYFSNFDESYACDGYDGLL